MKHSTLILVTLVLSTLLIAATSRTQPITYPPGGYDYPAKDSVSDTDFYFYPLRKIFTRSDSFQLYTTNLFYKAFDEPNLSIQPMGADVFRFSLEFYRDLRVVVRFTKNTMIVKIGRYTNMTEGILDEGRLNEIEKRHYDLMRWHFPFESWARNQYMDSMINLYPQLLDAKYFKRLYDKAKAQNPHRHRYTVRSIDLSTKEFKRLVSIINDSGYWKLPYEVPCDDIFVDGYEFSLEASTKNKYNFVRANICNDDKLKFAAICQEIVENAGLEKQIDLAWFKRPKKPEVSKPAQVAVTDVTLADVKEDSDYNRKKTTHKHK